MRVVRFEQPEVFRVFLLRGATKILERRTVGTRVLELCVNFPPLALECES